MRSWMYIVYIRISYNIYYIRVYVYTFCTCDRAIANSMDRFCPPLPYTAPKTEEFERQQSQIQRHLTWLMAIWWAMLCVSGPVIVAVVAAIATAATATQPIQRSQHLYAPYTTIHSTHTHTYIHFCIGQKCLYSAPEGSLQSLAPQTCSKLVAYLALWQNH